MTLIVRDGVLAAPGDSRVLHGQALALSERVEAVGPFEELCARFPGARILHARGGLVLPGLVNLHHHFYSLYARGLDPGPGVTSFPDVLARLWWRLDRALDPDAVLYAALASLAECVRSGVTTVFDHHSSPPCIGGILDVLAAAVREAGLSAVLCYEVSDRNGHEEAISGLEENLRFLSARAGDPRVRGALGLHASFTLSDETLRAVAVRRPAGAGVHIHAAEHAVDGEVSRREHGHGPVARLEHLGLLDDRTLLAHGVHLSEAELGTVARTGAILVHNPESNAHNGVGRLDVPAAARLGCAVGLGTDGMSSSVLRALRAALLAEHGATRDPSSGFAVLPGLLAANARVAGRFLDEPLLGTLAPGAPADVIVVDAPPPTSIGGKNLFSHLVFGAAEAPVRHTIARGRVLMEDFRLLHLDPEALARKAAALSRDVWRRFHVLAPDVPSPNRVEVSA